MARKILNRKGLRADYDAAERRKQDEEEVEETDEEEEEDGEDEEKEADEDEEKQASEEEEEKDEEAPKKSKPPAKPAKPVKAKAKSRARTPKIVRMKVVWGVFNNSNQRVATFDYPKRKDANDLAEKLMADKKVTHFVQPVKEPIEEKKEKEKEKG